uniref:CCHC-type domain-containing protein n=1 Tax=Octopus bimaculoides TaxID=37653 RepID=A0A0L8H963_OCTBM
MAEKQTVELIKLFREQMDQQMQQHKRDMDTLLKLFGARQVEGDSSGYFSAASTTVSIPPFAAFDSTTELWPDYCDMQRKPGETLQELAAHIRQDAATCDFPSITNPQNEALRQRFICLVNNEAVLKALFKIKDTELDFARAIQVAIETEDAAKVAKETVYGSKTKQVYKVQQYKNKIPQKNHQQSYSTNQEKCYRCGKAHKVTDCPFKESKCHFCDKKGHFQATQTPVKRIAKAELVKAVLSEVSQDTHSLIVPITIQNRLFTMELETTTTGNFVSLSVWKQLGRPKLQDVKHRYESASKHDLPVLGTFMGQTKDPTAGKQNLIPYIVTKISDLNFLGRNAIQTLGISVDTALGLKSIDSQAKREDAEVMYPKTSSEPYVSLQQDCHKMCDEFPDLFKQELGCLKNFELEVKFKSDATPVFHKARPVPFALRVDLAKGYEEGIAKGIWKPVQFNEYGMPVVPIRKAHASNNLKLKLRICGDYSVGINDQLADHRHPMPLPVELMQKLGGGFGYTKIDLADVIPHGPMWRRHWEQLRPQYTTEEDNEPGDAENTVFQFATDHPMAISETVPLTQRQARPKTMLPVPEYEPDNPRRSKRTRKTQERLCC